MALMSASVGEDFPPRTACKTRRASEKQETIADSGRNAQYVRRDLHAALYYAELFTPR